MAVQGTPQLGWWVETSKVPLFKEVSLSPSLGKPNPFAPWPFGSLRLLEVGILPAGPSPRWGSAQVVSCPCQVAMETDLEVLTINWYLLGICSFLDAVTSTVQEREKGRTPPPQFCIVERVSFCNGEVKTQEKLNRKDIFFLLITRWVFFFWLRK